MVLEQKEGPLMVASEGLFVASEGPRVSSNAFQKSLFPNLSKLNQSIQNSSPKKVEIDLDYNPASPQLLNFSEYTRHYPTSQLSSTPCRRHQQFIKANDSLDETVQDTTQLLLAEQILTETDDWYTNEIKEFEQSIPTRMDVSNSTSIQFDFGLLESAYSASLSEYSKTVTQAQYDMTYLQQQQQLWIQQASKGDIQKGANWIAGVREGVRVQHTEFEILQDLLEDLRDACKQFTKFGEFGGI